MSWTLLLWLVSNCYEGRCFWKESFSTFHVISCLCLRESDVGSSLLYRSLHEPCKTTPKISADKSNLWYTESKAKFTHTIKWLMQVQLLPVQILQVCCTNFSSSAGFSLLVVLTMHILTVVMVTLCFCQF